MPRLSRDDWVDTALAVLAREGPAAVTIDALATALGATKGSFYWHFRDREDLDDAVLTHWERVGTQDVFDAIRAVPGSPEARLRALAETTTRLSEPDQLLAMEVAIRAWATFQKGPSRRVRQVDAARLEFVTGLFREVGLRKPEAELRARMFYFYLVGEWFSLVKVPLPRRLELVRGRLDLLLAPAAD